MTMMVRKGGEDEWAKHECGGGQEAPVGAFGKEQFIITKRGKPMARLVPAEENVKHLAEARGWLEEGDDFFQTMDCIVRDRSKHAPRAVAEQLEE